MYIAVVQFTSLLKLLLKQPQNLGKLGSREDENFPQLYEVKNPSKKLAPTIFLVKWRPCVYEKAAKEIILINLE